jgi:hypothetical protein
MSDTKIMIDAKYDNPIDNVLIAISDFMSPTFKRLNFTADGLTALSIILSVASLYNLSTKDTAQFVAYGGLAYLFDTMSRVFAAKYNDQIFEYGVPDAFRYKNSIILLIAAIILYQQYRIVESPVLIVVLICLFFLSLVTAGCQEVVINNMPNKEICQDRLGYLRWVGKGTFVTAFILIVLFLNNDFSMKSVKSIFCDDCKYDRSSESSSDVFSQIMEPLIQDFNKLDEFELVPNRSVASNLNINNQDLAFLNRLKTFGSANLNDLNNTNMNTSSNSLDNLNSFRFGPYSSNTMVDRMIQD